MSMPAFPQLDPPLTREGSLSEIIASIAAEELSLSHILNAEGEKLQYLLGTLPGLSGDAPDLADIREANDSVQAMLAAVTQHQMLLAAKLTAALEAPLVPGPTGPAGPAGPTGPAEGVTGPTGPTGATGPAGPTGTAGLDGAAGPAGPAGADGVTGPTGPAGLNGLDGAAGPAGPAGPAGAAGPDGAVGPTGPTGPDGAAGVAGATGPTGPDGAAGPVGAVGLTGAVGVTGPTGPTGPSGPNPTATAAYAANTSGSSINIALGGTNIPLPDAQVLSAGVTVNAGNTVFTVAPAGRYRISYYVNTTAALLMGSRLVINGVNNTASTVSPAVAATNFASEIDVDLPANATVSLQMFPQTLAGVAVLTGGGAGASLMIVRLS